MARSHRPRDLQGATAASTPDRALVSAARRGDVDAFERLLRRHDDRMRALAFRMTGSTSAMDDVLQDAYLKAFRGLDRFRGDSGFATWLHRIVVTTALDHDRHRRRRAEDPFPDDDGTSTRPAGLAAVPAPGPDAGVRATGRVDLRRALGALPGDHRIVVLLVDGDGLSYDEAGEVLGIPAGTVASRLSRARAHLRALLGTTDGTEDR